MKPHAMPSGRSDAKAAQPGSGLSPSGDAQMPNRIADTVREHEAIMQAILAHDPERAHSTMPTTSICCDNLWTFSHLQMTA